MRCTTMVHSTNTNAIDQGEPSIDGATYTMALVWYSPVVLR